MENNLNTCTYCNKTFQKERTLQVHVCEPKRRHLQKDEKWVKNGFLVFQKFYEVHQNTGKPKTYKQFCESSYYNAFVKFGRYLMYINPLYPEKYIDFIVRSKIKLDHWARDELYEKYVLEFILKEDVTTALERSVQTMLEWAADNEPAPWTHYFHHISLNRAVWHIKDGKISPWLILNCKSGKEMLSKFNDEQLEMVYHVINPEHWAMRFKRLPNDVQLVKDVAKESNL